MFDKKIGISIYLGKNPIEQDLQYLQLASTFGASRLFICFLNLDSANKDAFLSQVKILVNLALALNYAIYIDVNRKILKLLDITYDDLDFFISLGVTGIRLDEGFTGFEESSMSYNANLKIEINASNGTKYLDNIISFQANLKNLTACHNFYPRRYTGLSHDYFLSTSQHIKNYGIKLAAFVTSQNANTFSNQTTMEGLPTIENHRTLPLINQAKELFYSNLIDDVIIGNAYASESELKELCLLNKDLITLDIHLEPNLPDMYLDVLLNNLHFNRGDNSEYVIRSTETRIKYKHLDIPAFNTKKINPFDVTVDNNNYNKYKGELHIALKPMENDGNVNVIGRVAPLDTFLLSYVKPWSKFQFNIIKKD